MPIFEVWEYGEGDGPRNTYTAVSEERAMKTYLERQLVTGKTYRHHLQQDGIDRLLLCVKNPALKGTRQNPNYPSVYTLEFENNIESAFEGKLVNGEIEPEDTQQPMN